MRRRHARYAVEFPESDAETAVDNNNNDDDTDVDEDEEARPPRVTQDSCDRDALAAQFNRYLVKDLRTQVGLAIVLERYDNKTFQGIKTLTSQSALVKFSYEEGFIARFSSSSISAEAIKPEKIVAFKAFLDGLDFIKAERKNANKKDSHAPEARDSQVSLDDRISKAYDAAMQNITAVKRGAADNSGNDTKKPCLQVRFPSTTSKREKIKEFDQDQAVKPGSP